VFEFVVVLGAVAAQWDSISLAAGGDAVDEDLSEAFVRGFCSQVLLGVLVLELWGRCGWFWGHSKVDVSSGDKGRLTVGELVFPARAYVIGVALSLCTALSENAIVLEHVAVLCMVLIVETLERREILLWCTPVVMVLSPGLGSCLLFHSFSSVHMFGATLIGLVFGILATSQPLLVVGTVVIWSLVMVAVQVYFQAKISQVKQTTLKYCIAGGLLFAFDDNTPRQIVHGCFCGAILLFELLLHPLFNKLGVYTAALKAYNFVAPLRLFSSIDNFYFGSLKIKRGIQRCLMESVIGFCGCSLMLIAYVGVVVFCRTKANTVDYTVDSHFTLAGMYYQASEQVQNSDRVRPEQNLALAVFVNGYLSSIPQVPTTLQDKYYYCTLGAFMFYYTKRVQSSLPCLDCALQTNLENFQQCRAAIVDHSLDKKANERYALAIKESCERGFRRGDKPALSALLGSRALESIGYDEEAYACELYGKHHNNDDADSDDKDKELDAHTSFHQGVVAVEGKKFKDAESLLERSVLKQPGFFLAWEKLAAVQATLSKFTKAKLSYLKAHRLNRTDSDIIHRVGLLVMMSKENEEAREWFEFAIKLAHKNGDIKKVMNIRSDICHSFLDDSDAEGVLDCSEKSTKLAGTPFDENYAPVNIYNHRGIAFAWEEKASEAIASFRMALETSEQRLAIKSKLYDVGPHADAHNNLGTMFLRDGSLVEAKQHFEAALRIVPTHPHAKGNLDSLLAQSTPVPAE